MKELFEYYNFQPLAQDHPIYSTLIAPNQNWDMVHENLYEPNYDH